EADAGAGGRVEGRITPWREPERLRGRVRGYRAALDQAAAEAAKTEDADSDVPPGTPPAPPKVTSLTDPTAAWTNKGQRKVGFAYGTNYLIDLRRAIIYRRRRSDTGALERRSGHDKDNAGANPRALWPQAAAAGSRSPLRIRA